MDLHRGSSAVELLTSSYDDMDWSNACAAVEDRPDPNPQPACKATMRPSVLQVHESKVTQTRLGFWKGFADGDTVNDVTQGGNADDATRLGLWNGLEEADKSDYGSREDKADDATRSPSSAQRSSTGTFDAEISAGPVPEVAEIIHRRRSSIEDIYDGGAPWDLMGVVSGSHVQTGSATSEVMLLRGLQHQGGQQLQTERSEERHQEVHAQGVELPVQPRQSFQPAQVSELPRRSQQVLLGQARQSLQVLQQEEQEHDRLQPRLSQQLPPEQARQSLKLVHRESHEHDRLQPRLSQRLQPRPSQPLLPEQGRQPPQALERGQDDQHRLRQEELEEERFRLQRQQEEFRQQGEERQAQHRKETLELDQQRLRQHELERQLQMRQLEESQELREERERLHAQRQELERAQLLFQEHQEHHRAEQQQQLQQQAQLQHELQRQELRLQEQHSHAQLQEQQEQCRLERLREPQHRSIHFEVQSYAEQPEEPEELQQYAPPTTYGTPQGVCSGVNAASATTVSPAGSTAGEWTFMPNAPYSARSSSRRPLGEKPIEEWDEEDVVRWLLQFSTVPEDLVILLRTHAITGAVLLTLSDEDFVELGINKFGYRRLLAVGAQQLRVHLERARNLAGTNASSRPNSLALLQMQPAPVQVKQPALEPSAQQVHSSRCPQVATASVPLPPRSGVAKSSSVAVPSLRSTIGGSPSKPQLRQVVSPVWPSQLRTAPSRDESLQAQRPETARPRSLGLRTVSLESQSLTGAEVSGRRAAASPVAFSRAVNGRVVISPPRSPKRSWSPHERWP